MTPCGNSAEESTKSGFSLQCDPIDHPAMRAYPTKLFVEVTTRCNLTCPMCMKRSVDGGITEGDMSLETFKTLVPALSNCEALVLNGVGEPLLHPHLEEMVNTAKSVMPSKSWVGFQSNGLLLDKKKVESLVDAGLDKICISLDTLRPELFQKIREGAELQDLKKAFGALNEVRKEKGKQSLQVGVELIVMRDNLYHLPEVIRWAASVGVNFAIVTHLLPYTHANISQAAFDANTDAAVEHYRVWKMRAASQGIDMSKYFLINFYKFFRTPEEQRVVDFVQEMVTDARAKGIFFHLRNLIAGHEESADEVAKLFDQARGLAEDYGIELKLPAVMPKEARRCDFVEQGSALVSWRGDVHPCYFLWHSCNCHFSYWRKYVPGLDPTLGNASACIHSTYWKKTVAPRVFGNVKESGLLAIWNNENFRKFRCDVLLYDYPYCSNCNLVPCDHLTADVFERDCFETTIPCGDCFWVHGMYNCLM